MKVKKNEWSPQGGDHFFYQTCFAISSGTYNNQMSFALQYQPDVGLLSYSIGEIRLFNDTSKFEWIGLGHCEIFRCENVRTRGQEGTRDGAPKAFRVGCDYVTKVSF